MPRLLTLACLAAVTVAHAQAPPPPRAEGTAEASFVGTTGNASTQSIGLGAELFYRPAPWEHRFKASYVRNASGGVVQAQATAVTLRAQRPFAARGALFVTGGHVIDTFAGIEGRTTGELGVSATLINREGQNLSADAGGGYAAERRVSGGDVTTAVAGAGVLYKLALSETSELSEDVRAVAAVPRGGDWRLTNTFAVTARINAGLSLKVSNAVRYVNQPVPGFGSTDVVTSVAIVAKF